MNRAHIQKCKLFMHIPFWHFICNDDIYATKSELRKYNNNPPPNYNILDSILNNKDYDKFKIITEFLYKFWIELLLLLLLLIIIIIIIIKTKYFKKRVIKSAL